MGLPTRRTLGDMRNVSPKGESTRVKTIALAILLPLSLRAAAGIAAAKERPRPSCCFAHPQHAGTCVVHPARGETCASILTYLNRPRSTGKTYCENTTVRGGWTRVGCKPVGDAGQLPLPDAARARHLEESAKAVRKAVVIGRGLGGGQ
jgi:hypothetical protein